jgi:23S rRNA pseudouridine2605 synthase
MIKKYIPDSAESSTKAVKPVAAGKRNADSKSASAKPPKMTSPTQKSPRSESRSAAKAVDSKTVGSKTYGPKTSASKTISSKTTGTTAAGDRATGDRAAGARATAADTNTVGSKSNRSQKPSGAKTSAKPASDATPVVEAPLDEKLQKVLASAGLGSRREMERVIESGKVKVNDRIATLGDRVTSKDKIFVDGRRVLLRAEASRRRVILYNKPEGEICSRSDPEGRPTVYDNLPPLKGERWISVGRLDFNTSGLLLFTNDGELANKLMHPSSVIDREYLVRIQGEVDDEMKQHLLEGVLLDDGVARFTDIVDGAGEGKNRWFYCVVMEGRNREANIFIPSHVRVGQWIDLTDREIQDLCMTAGFDSTNYTRIMQASRDEQAQMQRHDKKLRSASSPPKRVKTTLRKKPK